MALRLILGSSGQGKTRYMMEEIIKESMDHPTRQYYVLVPEQFSLEMQRQMTQMHPRHGFSNIDVLSMHRLAYRVFEEQGYQPKEILEDLGVSMILKKILLEHEEEITYFRRSMKHPGFVDELKSMLFEFMNYGITAMDVSLLCDQLDKHPDLLEKCSELSKIYHWFTETIAEHFMVPGQIMDVMIDMVESSKMLQEGYFYLDGYTGFTPVQLEFLRRLLPQASQVTISVTIPYVPGGNRHLAGEEVFSFSEKTVYALWDLCKENGTEILEPVLLHKEQAVRYGSGKELAHLEQNLFRQKISKYEDPMEQIHAVTCNNPEGEAEYVLHKIEELVRTKGYRYRDFAVLMGNEKDYPSVFLRKSQVLHIPLFIDSKQKMTYHSGVETIRSLFHLVEMDYSYESVFRYLKSGMSDMTLDEIDFLENYVIAAGIRGLSQWKKPFERRLHRLDEEKIAKLEELREQLLRETLPFTLGMKEKKARVKEKMTVLYEVLCALHLPDKLKVRAQEAEDRGDFVKSKGYSQFFKEVLLLMDKIVAIFGEESLSLQEVSQLIDAGLEALTLASLPLSMDQVILGDLKRTRLPEIEVLFFVGVNDGDLPPVPEDTGILSDEEKRILEDHGITLSLNLTERVLEDEYYMYLAFSKPQDALYLTCCQTAADGSAKRPSSLFKTLQQLFSRLEMTSYPEKERRIYFNREDSKEYLIRQMRNWQDGKEIEESPQVFYALMRYWQEEDPEELALMYQRMIRDKKNLPLAKELIEGLYGMELNGSVTRLEMFASCPYRFFCTYGLGLQEREEYVLRPVDMGNLFHKALEFFSRRVKEEGYHWKDIPEEVQEQLIERSVNAVIEDNVKDVIESNHRNLYKKKMVRRILQRTVEVLRYHLRNSDFEPDHFEMRFGPLDDLDATHISLSGGKKMAFQGIVDRIDIYEEDDKIFVKIIDYKSGSTKFDFNKLYHGLQLQLVVYLNAALEKYQKEKKKAVEPAGLFYYQIQDPIQKEKDAAGDKVWNIFKMSGYANSDMEILEHLEHGDGLKQSIEVGIKADGSLRKDAHVMNTDDFYRVGDYVKKTMKEIGERIYSGDISVAPYKLGKEKQRNTSCEFCLYASVCGFDETDAAQGYRLLQKENNAKVLEKIRKEME